MASIKRVKGGKALYGKKISPAGVVVEWTASEADAFQFEQSSEEHRKLADKVVSHYADRADAGAISIGNKPVNDHAKVAAAEKALADKAEAEAKAQAESLKVLKEKAAKCDEMESQLKEAREQIAILRKAQAKPVDPVKHVEPAKVEAPKPKAPIEPLKK